MALWKRILGWVWSPPKEPIPVPSPLELKNLHEEALYEDELWEQKRRDDELFALHFGLGFDEDVEIAAEKILAGDPNKEARDERILQRLEEFEAKKESTRLFLDKFGDLERTPRESRSGTLIALPLDHNDKAWQERKPIAPLSALYVPRSLSEIEKHAVALVDLLEGVKLKGKLRKKLVDYQKGSRRMTFDKKGKMKEVKGA